MFQSVPLVEADILYKRPDHDAELRKALEQSLIQHTSEDAVVQQVMAQSLETDQLLEQALRQSRQEREREQRALEEAIKQSQQSQFESDQELLQALAMSREASPDVFPSMAAVLAESAREQTRRLEQEREKKQRTTVEDPAKESEELLQALAMSRQSNPDTADPALAAVLAESARAEEERERKHRAALEEAIKQSQQSQDQELLKALAMSREASPDVCPSMAAVLAESAREQTRRLERERAEKLELERVLELSRQEHEQQHLPEQHYTQPPQKHPPHHQHHQHPLYQQQRQPPEQDDADLAIIDSERLAQLRDARLKRFCVRETRPL